MTKSKLKMFLIKSLLGNRGLFAHSEEEAFENFSENKNIKSGDLFNINGNYFRYVHGKLIPHPSTKRKGR